MTQRDIAAVGASMDQLPIAVTSAIEFPVEVGERWPVIRTGEREPINRTLRRLIYQRDGKRCRLCGKAGWLFELDHIIPWSAGGPDTSDNLRSVCHACNQARSNYRRSGDALATPVTHACDPCILEWVRRYGMTRYGRVIPGATPIAAYCGSCASTSHVTDSRRLK